MKVLCVTTRENLNDPVFHIADMPTKAENELNPLDVQNMHTLDGHTIEFSFKRNKPYLKKVEGYSLLYICDTLYTLGGVLVKEDICGVYHTGLVHGQHMALLNAIESVKANASPDKFREYAEKAVGLEEFVAARKRFVAKFGGKL